MRARQEQTALTRGPRRELGVAWWLEFGRAVDNKALSDLDRAEPGDGSVVQRNSSVQPYTLCTRMGDVLHVAVKAVDLDCNTYRDEEHRERSRKSYQVETWFYEAHARSLAVAGVAVPAFHGSLWNAGGTRGVLVIGDLTAAAPAPSARPPPSVERHSRSEHQRLALCLEDAEAALAWLARFHAYFWAAGDSDDQAQAGDTGAWPAGGYWSLDKRGGDLPRMEAEWARWLAAMAPAAPDAVADPAVQGLARCLRDLAPRLDAALRAHGRQHGRTLVHGDAKTANAFFHAALGGDGPAHVALCDFQWLGHGLGVQDAMYLMWTSVEPAVLARHEARLLQGYAAALAAALGARGVAHVPALEVLQAQYEVALLDYVRFLIGAMWGACTPETHAAKRGDINQGMHKRSVEHQVHMVQRAVAVAGAMTLHS